MSEKLSQIAEKYIKEKHTGCKGFEYDAFKDGYAQALADNALAIKIYEKIKELGLAPLNGWSCYNSSCVFDIYVKGKSKCCLGFNRRYEENYNKYKRCGSHDLEACAKFFGGSDAETK